MLPGETLVPDDVAKSQPNAVHAPSTDEPTATSASSDTTPGASSQAPAAPPSTPARAGASHLTEEERVLPEHCRPPAPTKTAAPPQTPSRKRLRTLDPSEGDEEDHVIITPGPDHGDEADRTLLPARPIAGSKSAQNATRDASTREIATTSQPNFGPVVADFTNNQSRDELAQLQSADFLALADEASSLLSTATSNKCRLTPTSIKRMSLIINELAARERTARQDPASRERRRGNELAAIEGKIDSLMSMQQAKEMRDRIAERTQQAQTRGAPKSYSQVAGLAPPHQQPPMIVVRPRPSTQATASQPAPRPPPTRVVLRTSKLDSTHPLRIITMTDVRKRVAKPLQDAFSISIIQPHRLHSGDIAIPLKSEEEVKKVLEADDKWIADALSQLGPVPAITRPNRMGERSLVLHGVLLSENLDELGKEIEQEHGVAVQSCRWLLGAARRKDKKASSVVLELANASERNALRQGYRLLVGGRAIVTDDYRPPPRAQQCGRCQGFGHPEGRCMSVPICRVCAKSHHTKYHPKCLQCVPDKDDDAMTEDGSEDEGTPTPTPTAPTKCTHVKPRCTNCKGEHTASSRTCPSRAHFIQEQIAKWVIIYVHRRLLQANITTVGHRHPDFTSISIQIRQDDPSQPEEKLYIHSIYNPSRSSDTIPPFSAHLEAIDPAANGRHIVAGDFNCHHPSWQTNLDAADEASDAWLMLLGGYGLELVTPPDTYTFTARTNGSEWALDLAFADAETVAALVDCTAKSDWSQASDHTAVLTRYALATRLAAPTARFNMKRCDGMELAKVARRMWEGESAKLASMSADVEPWAETLVRVTQAALEATTPMSRPSPHAKPWFDQRLGWQRKAVARLRRAWQDERDPEVKAQRRGAYQRIANSYTSAIRKAKRDSARTAMAAPGDKLWSMAKAGSRSRATAMVAALESANGEATTAEEKESVLRAKFFPPPPAQPTPDADATAGSNEQGPTPAWSWAPITAGEVRRRIEASKKDTAAGVDMIPWSAHRHLALHWPLYPNILASIFNACIEQGVHPRIYKLARTVCLRKPGKESYTKAGSYRPITLLSTTGKTFEGLVAGRVLRIAESTSGVIAAEHYGGRPFRAVEDATLKMQQFVKDSHAAKRTVTMLAVDVSGAYNSVAAAPLLRDLEKAGWPPLLRTWVASFMRDRRSRLQVGDYCGQEFSCDVGLPQGSPLSQLLWLTFSNGLVKSLGDTRDVKQLSVGWVDDWTALVAARDPALLQERLDAISHQAEDWSLTHGATFDAEKSALMTFRRRGAAAVESPTVVLRGEEVNAVEHTKVLGVIFEAGGSFKLQAAERAEKALKAARILLSWGNKLWGFSWKNARLLYIAGVLPKMTFGCLAWLPTAADPNKGRVEFLKRFAQVQRQAAITITGAFRTTSSTSLDHEANLLPVEQAFDMAQARSLARLRTAPANHPLSRDVDKWIRRTRERHRPPLYALAKAYPEVAKAKLSRKAAPRLADWTPPYVVIPYDKETALILHQLAECDAYGEAHHLYTDGSRDQEGRVGAAAVWEQQEGWRVESRGLGNKSTIMRAEVEGVRLALELVEHSNLPRRQVFVWCDSQAALKAISSINSSSADVRRVQDAITRMREGGQEVRLQWLPSHLDTPGNDKADEEAKAATRMAPLGQAEAPSSTGPLLTKVKARLLKDAEVAFKEGKAAGLKDVIKRYDPAGSQKRHAGLSRPMSSLLTQVRTGHCSIDDYLFQRKIGTSPQCSCGSPRETRRHLLLECPIYEPQRQQLRREIGRAANSVTLMLDSSNPKITRAVLRFLGARFPRNAEAAKRLARTSASAAAPS